MKLKICKYCGRPVTDGYKGYACGKCFQKKEDVHELYLICQLIRKKACMKYDPILDVELRNIKKK